MSDQDEGNKLAATSLPHANDEPPMLQDSIAPEIVKSNHANSKPQVDEYWLADVLDDQKSLYFGVIGLGVFACILAAILPVGIGLLNNLFNIGRPPFVLMAIISQTLFLPPVIGFSFAAVTPMFWYGPVFFRFIMALVAVLPSCVVFYFLMFLVEGSPPRDFLIGFCVVMFVSLVGIAAVALTFQLWTRWTLTHRGDENEILPPTGIRSLIELTVIVAIGSAVLSSVDLKDYVQGIVIVAGVAVLVGLAVIITYITFLGDRKNSRIAIAIPALVIFLAAASFNGFMAYTEFGRSASAIADSLGYVFLVSLYGSILLCVLIWLLLRWIRSCGWRCVARNRNILPELEVETGHPLE